MISWEMTGELVTQDRAPCGVFPHRVDHATAPRRSLRMSPRRSATTSRDETWDYLVVGRGVAGLAFGTARAGRRVRVLEAHHRAGGYGHTFAFGNDGRRSRFNAQFHYMWNCGEGGTVHNFLASSASRGT